MHLIVMLDEEEAEILRMGLDDPPKRGFRNATNFLCNRKGGELTGRPKAIRVHYECQDGSHMTSHKCGEILTATMHARPYDCPVIIPILGQHEAIEESTEISIKDIMLVNINFENQKWEDRWEVNRTDISTHDQDIITLDQHNLGITITRTYMCLNVWEDPMNNQCEEDLYINMDVGVYYKIMYPNIDMIVLSRDDRVRQRTAEPILRVEHAFGLADTTLDPSAF